MPKQDKQQSSMSLTVYTFYTNSKPNSQASKHVAFLGMMKVMFNLWYLHHIISFVIC